MARAYALAILLLLASCGQGATARTTTPDAAPSPTITASPTPIPIPSLLLMSGEDSEQLQAALQDWTQEREWLLESRTEQDLAGWAETPGLQAVVEIGTGLSAEELASAVPGVAIVSVDHPAALPGALLSTVGGPNVRHDQAGFLAGALTGLASQSWVVAAISSGGEHDAVYQAAFEHGLKYSCPRCWPEMMGAWEATAEELLARRVDAVFVLPGADQLPSSLFASNIWFVYVGEAPSGLPSERTAGSVIFDAQPLVLPALESLQAGEAGKVWPYAVESGSMIWGPLNANAISPARDRILTAVWQSLASGELEVGVDPITGAER